MFGWFKNKKKPKCPNCGKVLVDRRVLVKCPDYPAAALGVCVAIDRLLLSMHHAGLGKLWPNVGDRTGRENYAALLRELGREAEAAAMEARAEAIRAGRASSPLIEAPQVQHAA